jgi:hypothetical protein
MVDEGTIYDCLIESQNDDYEYDEVATQEDFDSW